MWPEGGGPPNPVSTQRTDYSAYQIGIPLSVNMGILDYRIHKTVQYKTLGTLPGSVGLKKSVSFD